MTPTDTTPSKDPIPADQIELKRWHPQPETAPPTNTAEDKAFAAEAAKQPPVKVPPVDTETDAPHAKPAETPLDADTKHDHLADNIAEATVKPKKRQDALIDEGLEETFPASDPVSVKHIS